MEKEPLSTFLWRRYVNTFGFTGTIILVAIAIGVFCNLLDDYTDLSWEAVSAIGEVLMFLLVGVSIYTMFSKRRLKGPLGKWQALWLGIPTWKERHAEEVKK